MVRQLPSRQPRWLGKSVLSGDIRSNNGDWISPCTKCEIDAQWATPRVGFPELRGTVLPGPSRKRNEIGVEKSRRIWSLRPDKDHRRELRAVLFHSTDSQGYNRRIDRNVAPPSGINRLRLRNAGTTRRITRGSSSTWANNHLEECNPRTSSDNGLGCVSTKRLPTWP
jgi:hypothetical protein